MLKFNICIFVAFSFLNRETAPSDTHTSGVWLRNHLYVKNVLLIN